jgi:hypothetical protein
MDRSSLAASLETLCAAAVHTSVAHAVPTLPGELRAGPDARRLFRNSLYIVVQDTEFIHEWYTNPPVRQ